MTTFKDAFKRTVQAPMNALDRAWRWMAGHLRAFGLKRALMSSGAILMGALLILLVWLVGMAVVLLWAWMQ